MPGYADYKKLYIEEYKTLFDEGFGECKISDICKRISDAK